MADFTLHLGFTWNSLQVGSIWNPSDDDQPSAYRFLQYALADASGNPAWFEFAAGDQLSVVVWDLSPASDLLGPLQLELSMSFAPVVGAARAYDPDQLVTRGESMTVSTHGGQPFLSFGAIGAATPGDGPWGPGASHRAGTLTLSEASRYKLSFLVSAGSTQHVDTRQSFVSDPEVIVGSAG